MPAKPAPENSENQEKLEPVAPEEKKEVSAGNLLKLILLSLGVVFGDIAINPPLHDPLLFSGKIRHTAISSQYFQGGILDLLVLEPFRLTTNSAGPGFAWFCHPSSSIFVFMVRNSLPTTEFFEIPYDRIGSILLKKGKNTS
jgi:K+ transporter